MGLFRPILVTFLIMSLIGKKSSYLKIGSPILYHILPILPCYVTKHLKMNNIFKNYQYWRKSVSQIFVLQSIEHKPEKQNYAWSMRNNTNMFHIKKYGMSSNSVWLYKTNTSRLTVHHCSPTFALYYVATVCQVFLHCWALVGQDASQRNISDRTSSSLRITRILWNMFVKGW